MTYGVRRTYPFLRDTRRRGARLREEIIEFALVREDAGVAPHRNVVAYDRCQPRGFGLVPRNGPCVKGLLEDLVGFEGKIRKRHRLEILMVVPILFLDIKDRSAFVNVGELEFPYHLVEQLNWYSRQYLQAMPLAD